MRRLFVLLILFSTACGPAVLVPIDTPTSTPTSTLTPTPTSTLTPTLNPIPTIKLLFTCPTPRDLEAPVAPPGLRTTGLLESILLYSLNLGANPEKLVNELNTPAYDNPKLKLIKIDFNNDGVDELAISSGPSLLNGTPFVNGLVSAFWIFQCRNGKYDIQVTMLERENIVDGSPAVVDVEDLKGDKQKEVVVQSSQILVSECREVFGIFGWKENVITAYMDQTTTFPCGTKFAVGSSDENGNKEILFTGQSDLPSDAVAGIQRRFVDTYVLKDNQSYQLKSHSYLSSP